MNKPIKKWSIIIIIIVILTAGYFTAQRNQSSELEEIKVGIIMPLSGDLAAFGKNAQHGVEIALAQSGLQDKIEIITEDIPEFNPASALSAYKKVTDIDNVDIVIGPFGPAQSLAVAPNIDSESMTVIGMTNCDDRLLQYPSLLCIYPSISDQVTHSIEFMKQRGWNNVYLFTEQSEFGILVEEQLRNSADINLLGTEKVVPNQTTDFRTLIAKMITAEPDVVYSMLSPNEGFVMLGQFSLLADGTPLMTGSDVNIDQMKELFGDDAPDIYSTGRLNEAYDPVFVEKFKEKTGGSEPDYFAALAHSATSVLFKTLQNKNLSHLPDSMFGVSTDSTAVPEFVFQDNGTASIPLFTFEFKNGAFVVAK